MVAAGVMLFRQGLFVNELCELQIPAIGLSAYQAIRPSVDESCQLPSIKLPYT